MIAVREFVEVGVGGWGGVGWGGWVGGDGVGLPFAWLSGTTFPCGMQVLSYIDHFVWQMFPPTVVKT